MKLIFSAVAQEEYNEIIIFLHSKFGTEHAKRFSETLKNKLQQIKTFPESCPHFFDTRKRKFLVNAYTTVIYDFDKDLNRIEILNFWFNRLNPESVLQHL